MAVARITLMAATTAKLHLRKAGGHGRKQRDSANQSRFNSEL
jgi:hypothetical protein